MRAAAPTLLAFALLACCTAPVAFADAPAATTPPPAPLSGVTGLDAMTATVFQQGQSSFSGIALRLRVHSALLPPAVEVLPTVEYWQNTSHVDEFGVELKRRDATLAADGRWLFRSRPWRPYAGGGFGLHFLDNSARMTGQTERSKGLVKGGLDVFAGMESASESRLGSFLEFKFLDVTHYRQFKFSTGLSWAFR